MGNPEKDIAEAVLKVEGLSAGKLGLRFDKVVVRVLHDLRSFADGTIPEGRAVAVTISAPIRLPAKTAEVIAEQIEALGSADAGVPDAARMINGNTVSVRIVDRVQSGRPKLVGFVHNLDSDPIRLLDLAERWLCD